MNMSFTRLYFSIEIDLSIEFSLLHEKRAKKQYNPCFFALFSCSVLLFYMTTISLALMLKRLFKGSQTALHLTALL